MTMRVIQYGHSVFLVDGALGDLTLYAEKFRTKRAARKMSDQLCGEIASGLPREKLSVAADIEKRMDALRHLPPCWR